MNGSDIKFKYIQPGTDFNSGYPIKYLPGYRISVKKLGISKAG